MHHGGRWLRDEIERSGKSKQAWARDIGVQPVTLRSWFGQIAPRMRPPAFANLGRRLNLQPDDLRAKLEGPSRSIADMLEPGVPIGEDGTFVSTKGSIVNVEQTAPGMVQYVPIVNAISASALIDKSADDYAIDIADSKVPVPFAKENSFALVVDGDCMSPRYQHGEIVIFHLVEDPAEIKSGKDYAVHYDAEGGNESTFKQLTVDRSRPGRVIARCLNPSFKPRQFYIDVRRIVRLGVAVMTVHK